MTLLLLVIVRRFTRLAPSVINRSVGELRTALQCVQGEINNVRRAIAKGGELESFLDELRDCEKRRDDLRAMTASRERAQGREIDRPRLEAAVRRRVNDWRSPLSRRPGHGRQLLREMLTGPITFTPIGRAYRFRGEASFGALVGEAGTPFLVPVRGYEKWCSAENVEFRGIAA